MSFELRIAEPRADCSEEWDLVSIRGLECEHCGGTSQDLTLFVCPSCVSPMSVTYRYDEIAKQVTRHSFESEDAAGVWRYGLLLPDVSPANRISLGEGQTRLARCTALQKELGLQRLYAKLDSLNPTGSFKDRGQPSVFLLRWREAFVPLVAHQVETWLHPSPGMEPRQALDHSSSCHRIRRERS